MKMPTHATFTFVLLVSFGIVCQAEKPNIVLVMADDQGWGDMAYNGHSLVKTPNFDKAAATGLQIFPDVSLYIYFLLQA